MNAPHSEALIFRKNSKPYFEGKDYSCLKSLRQSGSWQSWWQEPASTYVGYGNAGTSDISKINKTVLPVWLVVESVISMNKMSHPTFNLPLNKQTPKTWLGDGIVKIYCQVSELIFF